MSDVAASARNELMKPTHKAVLRRDVLVPRLSCSWLVQGLWARAVELPGKKAVTAAVLCSGPVAKNIGFVVPLRILQLLQLLQGRPH